MKCMEIFDQLSGYLDDDLNAEDCDEIETHMGKCPPCKAFLNTLQRTVDFCRDNTVTSLNDPRHAEMKSTLKRAYLEAVNSLMKGDLAAGQGFEPR